MLGLIIGAIAGVFIIAVLPSLLPDRYKAVLPSSVIWLLGALVILFALASTSFVYVPDGYSAHLFRIYLGRSLPPGKIVAADGENGPQARILAPGLHIEPLVNGLMKWTPRDPNLECRQRSDISPSARRPSCASADLRRYLPSGIRQSSLTRSAS